MADCLTEVAEAFSVNSAMQLTLTEVAEGMGRGADGLRSFRSFGHRFSVAGLLQILRAHCNYCMDIQYF